MLDIEIWSSPPMVSLSCRKRTTLNGLTVCVGSGAGGQFEAAAEPVADPACGACADEAGSELPTAGPGSAGKRPARCEIDRRKEARWGEVEGVGEGGMGGGAGGGLSV